MALQRGVGIRFNGKERTDVLEYAIEEGWIKVRAGKSRDRFGRPLLLTLKGEVQPYYRDLASVAADAVLERFFWFVR